MSELVAGVDEVGVCPMAGPVVAAAVILNPKQKIYKLNDSKVLSAQQREILYKRIHERALAISIGIATVLEIDQLNIFHATMLAMKRAIEGLNLEPARVLIDGRSAPNVMIPTQTIVGGDAKVKLISAASIIAKVTRDQMMRDLHLVYPQYHFDKHKGYPTKLHRDCLKTFGVSPIHRRSFALVRKRLLEE